MNKRIFTFLCAGASFLVPSAAMAQTFSQELTAEGTIAYECSILSTPLALVDNSQPNRLRTTTSSVERFEFSQTGNTLWELSVGEVSGDVNDQNLNGTFVLQFDEVETPSGLRPFRLSNDGRATPTGVGAISFVEGPQTDSVVVFARVDTDSSTDVIAPGNYNLRQVITCKSEATP